MRSKHPAVGIALVTFVIGFVLIAAIAWRLLALPLETDCYVNFNGTTFDQAAELEQALSADGLDAELSGQPGGPGRTPVVSVTDGGLLDTGGDLETRVAAALEPIGGGKIHACIGRALGD